MISYMISRVRRRFGDRGCVGHWLCYRKRMLAKFGATVAVNFLVDDPRGPEAVEKINAEGGKAIMAPGSVGEAGVVERMVLKAIDDLGRLDLLFNNAGTPGTRRASSHHPSLSADHRGALDVAAANQPVESVFRGSKVAAPALKAAHGAIGGAWRRSRVWGARGAVLRTARPRRVW